jgi:hypothetical protein
MVDIDALSPLQHLHGLEVLYPEKLHNLGPAIAASLTGLRTLDIEVSMGLHAGDAKQWLCAKTCSA